MVASLEALFITPLTDAAAAAAAPATADAMHLVEDAAEDDASDKSRVGPIVLSPIVWLKGKCGQTNEGGILSVNANGVLAFVYMNKIVYLDSILL